MKANEEIFSIVIENAKNSGKSTTIREVCKRLNPSEIYLLNLKERKLVPLDTIDIFENHRKLGHRFNTTLVIKVANKYLLIVAGSPTEQGKTITELFTICNDLKEISFILAAKRSYERKKEYETKEELRKLSTLIKVISFKRIKEVNFMKMPEWNDRIENIVKMIIVKKVVKE